jgi:transaldolase
MDAVTDALTGSDDIVPQTKKTKSMVSATPARKHIAVKLSNEELKDLKRIGLDLDKSSVDLATEAIREFIRKHRK